MENPVQLPWSCALVIGAGASGRAAAALLRHLGCEVRVYDRSPTATAPDGCVAVFGTPEVPREAFTGIDLLVLSPGVPPEPIRQAAATFGANVQVHGELSLALELFEQLAPGRPAVLITGTNGKSTVTALLGCLLESAGREPFVGGNLGEPLCTRVLACLRDGAALPDSLVIECSSYQLETLEHHPTAVAMVLNVTPDHLERYASFDAYAMTKARIFAGLSAGGLALLDATDSYTPRFRGEIPSAATCVEVDGQTPTSARIEGDGPGHTLHLPGGQSLPRDALQLAGRHNSKNALFAVLAARHLGLTLAQCRHGLGQFSGLAHRMVKVAEIDGVAYYNDSKATNVASVLAGLDGFARKFVLIAGGRAKGDDYSLLRGVLTHGGRGLVTIGEAGPAIAEATAGIVPTTSASSMVQALQKARAMARPGDAVILSPACSSFDWYDNFRHRGEVFDAAVRQLAG